MPYQEHPLLKTPKNRFRKIWRYMDFARFVSLLEEEALFFSRVSNLQVQDQFEGCITNATVKMFRKIPDHFTPEMAAKRKSIAEQNLRQIKAFRDILCVSSWHMADYESAAMWDIYVRDGKGVAVQSTIGRMKKAFDAEKESVNIGVVRYIDFNKKVANWNNVIVNAMNKRKSFQHERELRAVALMPFNAAGKFVRVDLKALIQKVHVAPSSPDWICDLIKKVLARYYLKVEVVHSDLDEKPLY